MKFVNMASKLAEHPRLVSGPHKNGSTKVFFTIGYHYVLDCYYVDVSVTEKRDNREHTCCSTYLGFASVSEAKRFVRKEVKP